MANPLEDRKKGLEEEYFRRKEQEALEKLRQRSVPEAPAPQTETTLPRCPKCGETLEEILFQEIMVDRCPGCQGVWLDSGELERLTAQDSQSWLARFRQKIGR